MKIKIQKAVFDTVKQL